MKASVANTVEILFIGAIIFVAFAGLRLLMTLDDPVCTIVQVGTDGGSYEREVCR